MKRVLLLVFSVLLFSQTKAQVIPISQAQTTAASTVVTVKGIALNGSEITNTRYIWDGTGGIVLYGSSVSTVNRGDTVTATGTVAPNYGLYEISTLTSVVVANSGNTLPAANVQTIPNGFATNFECNLMRFNNVSFTATGTFAVNTSYTITDGTNTAQIYFSSSSTAIIGQQIPVGTINIVGLMGVHSGTFQLLPRDMNDFIYNGNPPIITTPLVQTNITQTSFTVSFNTQNAGTTIINYGTSPTNLNMNGNSATSTTAHALNLTGLLPATIYYVQGISVSSTNDTSKSAVTAMSTISTSSGSIKIYFNNSIDASKAQYGHVAQYLNNSMADTLIAYIGRATNSLDIAIYNVDNNLGIISAVNAATTRGVAVRVICDDGVSAGVFNSFSTANKIQAPAPSTTYGIMHNKFAVIDKANPALATVIAGSTNWGIQEMQNDKNNMVIIQDQSLANGYTVEFEEMFVSHLFGSAKSNNTPHEYVIGGKRIEQYFSPSDGVNTQIMNHLATADYDLYTGLEVFTFKNIAYTIIDSAYTHNGAYYAGIVSDTANGQSAPMVFINNNISSHPELLHTSDSYIFHHKYAIIDPNDACSDPTVITGSHNWTTSANTINDENTLMIHDSTITNLYYQEFSQRYTDEGKTLVAKTYMPCPKSANGIASVKNNIAVQLFPNPSQDNTTLLLNENAGNKGVVSICDIAGKELMYINFNNQSRIEIASANLQSGIYLVNVNTEKGRTTLKWVLNK